MKKINLELFKSTNDYQEYKKTITNLIENKQFDYLKKQENYFDICHNFWIVDKYIAKGGQVNPTDIPNSLSAYDNAILGGYALQIPVQLLDDGNVVCFAHSNISQVIRNASGYLHNLTLEEIKEFSINDNNEKIPTLDEALNHIAGKTPIIIEIINDGMVEKLESKVITSIQKYITTYNCGFDVAIMSINPLTLEYFYNHYPFVTRILKSGQFDSKMYGSFKTKKLKKMKYYKATHSDFIVYTAELLPNAYVIDTNAVGIIANNIVSQAQYLKVAEHSDNIIFSGFEPKI